MPPGCASAAHAATIDAGSGTCSSISMHVTTSNARGRLARQRLRRDEPIVDRRRRIRADAAARRRAPSRTGRCRSRCAPRSGHRLGQDAAAAADVERRACRRGRLPARSIQSSRSGLISCSGRNSLSGSHQRCASAANFASSAGSALRDVSAAGVAVHRGAVVRSRRCCQARAARQQRAARRSSSARRSSTMRSPPTQTSVTSLARRRRARRCDTGS